MKNRIVLLPLVIAALVTALVFATSLNHLIKTPALAGYTWDTTIISQAGPPGGLDSLQPEPLPDR